MMAAAADGLQAELIAAALTAIKAQADEAKTALTAEDHLGVLVAVDCIKDEAERALADGVMRAYRHGRTWAEIGAALGMSKQAAWERFRHLAGK